MNFNDLTCSGIVPLDISDIVSLDANDIVRFGPYCMQVIRSFNDSVPRMLESLWVLTSSAKSAFVLGGVINMLLNGDEHVKSLVLSADPVPFMSSNELLFDYSSKSIHGSMYMTSVNFMNMMDMVFSSSKDRVGDIVSLLSLECRLWLYYLLGYWLNDYWLNKKEGPIVIGGSK